MRSSWPSKSALVVDVSVDVDVVLDGDVNVHVDHLTTNDNRQRPMGRKNAGDTLSLLMSTSFETSVSCALFQRNLPTPMKSAPITPAPDELFHPVSICHFS